MKKHIILLAATWCIVLCSGYSETETDRELAKIRSKFDFPDAKGIREAFEGLLTKKNPRVFELCRRIGADNQSFGALKEPAQMLDAQIDSLLLQKPEGLVKGIIAARVIWFYGPAITIAYWRRTGASAEMTKTVWKRKMPMNTIDMTSPLPEWDEGIDTLRVPLQECKVFEPLFEDPMPPTIIPEIVRQGNNGAAIIEMVTNSGASLKYHWAIRSSKFTRDLDFDAFQSTWFKLYP